MTNDYRPYRNIAARDPEVKKTDLIWIAAVICFIIYLLFCFIESNRPQDSQCLVPAAEKIRVERLLKKHGLQGTISVIEIHPADGSLWFERDGQLCQLQ